MRCGEWGRRGNCRALRLTMLKGRRCLRRFVLLLSLFLIFLFLLVLLGLLLLASK